ncbi:malate dehydrogenase [Deltaproteobacteria bacterium]|nr:malate dehydrogenase [Deltaproteobacteria bacterium]
MARLSRFFETFRDASGEMKMKVFTDGHALLRFAATNKGLAFTDEERVDFRLDGLLPPQVTTLEAQVDRVRAAYLREPTPIARYQYLRSLQERNELLFYALIQAHLVEMLPIIYTPTVGEAVQKFSALFQNARGLSLSPLNIDRAAQAVGNGFYDDVRMIVATDSSAILGIGDQGYGGLAIPIGKLSLYTAGGGVSPYRTLPVGLDVGTDRADLRENPEYVGVRQPRLKGEAYLDFMDKFVAAIKARYPRTILQWEDLSKDTAFTVLARYRTKIASFNDDVQGTGAVALAGVINACKLRGERLRDQRIIVYGAGAGGGGVSMAIHEGLMRDGLSSAEALDRLFVLDSKGLLMASRDMEDYKRIFAKSDAAISGWQVAGGAPNLEETIVGSGATILLGLSGQPGSFTEAHARAMAQNTSRPVIFPLSNPTASCEATPEDLVKWTDGMGIIATGSPFPPVTLSTGAVVPVGQGNNAFIFPGLGFGAILANATQVTDAMVMAASIALADYTEQKHLAAGLVYPPIGELQEVSIKVAAAVIAQAFADGVATTEKLSPETAEEYVRTHFWRPRYLPFVRG